MKLIQTITVGAGGAASIEFTSIPQTYTDLVLVTSLRQSDATVTGFVQFNGTGTTGLSVRTLYGTGSSAASNTNTAFGNLVNPSDYTASVFSSSTIYIPNYTGSTNKSFSVDAVTENNSTSSYAEIVAGLWSNTAAITSIKLLGNPFNLVQYSSASLYGILKGSGGATVS